MKRLLLPCFLALTVSLFAQPSTEKFSLAWTKGKVIFKTGDTLHCNIRFNQTANKSILQVNHAAHTLTIPTADVFEFSFFDEKRNRTRIFTTFGSAENGGPYFMEKLYADSRFCILNHKTMEVPPELNFSRLVGKPVKTYKKYLFNATTGEILPLSRENLFALLEPKRAEIISYVKARNIRFRRIADFISVFEYHNSL